MKREFFLVPILTDAHLSAAGGRAEAASDGLHAHGHAPSLDLPNSPGSRCWHRLHRWRAQKASPQHPYLHFLGYRKSRSTRNTAAGCNRTSSPLLDSPNWGRFEACTRWLYPCGTSCGVPKPAHTTCGGRRSWWAQRREPQACQRAQA